MRARLRGAGSVVALGVALSGCTAETREPPGDPPAQVRPLAPGDEVLPPGRYVARGFSQPFTFTVATPYWIVRQEEDSIVTLIGRDTEIVFATPTRVYEKLEGRLVPRARRLPEDLVAWLSSRADLRTGRQTDVSVGGREGTSIDVEIRELYEEAELLGCPLPCLPIAPADEHEPVFLTHTHRVMVFGERRRPLLIVYATGNPRGERAARALLDSVRFGVSEP